MKRFIALAASLLLLAPALASAAPPNSPAITITRSGSLPATTGSQKYFTGPVSVKMLAQPQPPSHVSAGVVTFAPGARTAWHTHPLGQILIVTAGTGWVQQWGGPREEIREGDVVWIPPGVKHWHGATATTAMTHVAIIESQDGKSVEWMEKVTDAQYDAR